MAGFHSAKNSFASLSSRARRIRRPGEPEGNLAP
jgi:hypothetical protein